MRKGERRSQAAQRQARDVRVAEVAREAAGNEVDRRAAVRDGSSDPRGRSGGEVVIRCPGRLPIRSLCPGPRPGR